MLHIFIVIFLSLFLLGCSSAPPPKNQDNLCEIFEQYPDWYKNAKAMHREWQTPIPLAIAIIKQESSFVHNAESAKKYFLGVIPTGRVSSSLGYSQAVDGTWADFERATNKTWNRLDFADSLQFIGWYTTVSHKELGIPFSDAYNHYRAYHDGHAGFKKLAKSTKANNHQQMVSDIAQRVAKQTAIYQKQLNACQAQLDGDRWWKFWR